MNLLVVSQKDGSCFPEDPSSRAAAHHWHLFQGGVYPLR